MLNEEHADPKYPFITYVEFCLCTDNVNNVCDNRDERQKESWMTPANLSTVLHVMYLYYNTAHCRPVHALDYLT